MEPLKIGNIFLEIIKLYQKIISPQMGPKCAFYPTCSEYGYLSINKEGPLRGIIMTTARLQRCQPCSSGYYPVDKKGRQLDLIENSNIWNKDGRKKVNPFPLLSH